MTECGPPRRHQRPDKEQRCPFRACGPGGFDARVFGPVLYGSGYEAFLPRAVDADRPQRVTVVGKHCESGDMLVRDARVPADLWVGSNYIKVLWPASSSAARPMTTCSATASDAGPVHLSRTRPA